jgi:serine/threonine-protein kinase
MAAGQKDDFVGRTIMGGQFEIAQRIGTGGMGSVYRASEPAMGREVAIKILHPKLKGRSDLVSRFRREARAMSQLAHPNTVRVFMYGELPEDGSLYIVMEMLEGKNLNQTVRKGGPMSAERAVPILVQVCQALHEAHQLGIVHRDLKPENIFICNQAGMVDYPKVLDFGLAKVTEQQMRPGSLILTQEGMVFGTPEFMSPEQARGQTLDARSDIYSLAVILYEVLTGKLPFDAKTPMEYVSKHVTAEPIPLNERVPGRTFAPGLEAAISRALAKDPNQRFQTAIAFAAALAPFGQLGGDHSSQPVIQLPADASAPAAAAQPRSAARNEPAVTRVVPGEIETARSGGPSLMVVAVACLVLGGLFAVLLMNLLSK